MNLLPIFSVFYYIGTFLMDLTTGLKCDCTTDECLDSGTRTCTGNWCYSETYNGVVDFGCMDKWNSLLCENRLSSKLILQSRVSHCCNEKDYCNLNIVPTQAPTKVHKEEKDTESKHSLSSNPDHQNDISYDKKHSIDDTSDRTECPCALNDSETGNTKMINPIYIAVPVAGVCVLLALIIFAMYLLRRRSDYYERYQYPRQMVAPPSHINGTIKQCSSPCKINRCTDSERSSSGSETKLFL